VGLLGQALKIPANHEQASVIKAEANKPPWIRYFMSEWRRYIPGQGWEITDGVRLYEYVDGNAIQQQPEHHLRPLFDKLRVFEVIDFPRPRLLALAREYYLKFTTCDQSCWRELRFLIAFCDIEPHEIAPDYRLEVFLEEREPVALSKPVLVLVQDAA
jgi:hypothetical protein